MTFGSEVILYRGPCHYIQLEFLLFGDFSFHLHKAKQRLRIYIFWFLSKNTLHIVQRILFFLLFFLQGRKTLGITTPYIWHKGCFMKVGKKADQVKHRNRLCCNLSHIYMLSIRYCVITGWSIFSICGSKCFTMNNYKYSCRK